jgi:outer membrane protein
MNKSTNNKLFTSQSIFNILTAGLLLFLLGQFFFRNNYKIAYVDSARIFNEYKGYEKAKTAYQTKAVAWQSNIDTLAQEIQHAIKKHEKDLATMSAKEQAMSRELIGAKQKQLTDYQRAIQENARQEDAKLTERVVSEINGFLLKYGKEHQYKLVLIANPSGTIAYAQEGLDITEEVLEALNQEYSGKQQ